MKIISYNVNGIRAAMAKDLIQWVIAAEPDVLCLQEIKAVYSQIDVAAFEALDYHCYWHSAEKKGYSGTAILTRKEPKRVHYGVGLDRYDCEGRVIRADFEDFSVFSVYVPSASNQARLSYKLEFCFDFIEVIQKIRREQPNLIISGDFNICHQPIDIHNPIGLQNVSGFLPEERAWMTHFMDKCELTDSFRYFNDQPGNYTWWSYRTASRERNKGWRLDYHFTTQSLDKKLKRASILKEARHSDHCPVMVDLDL